MRYAVTVKGTPRFSNKITSSFGKITMILTLNIPSWNTDIPLPCRFYSKFRFLCVLLLSNLKKFKLILLSSVSLFFELSIGHSKEYSYDWSYWWDVCRRYFLPLCLFVFLMFSLHEFFSCIEQSSFFEIAFLHLFIDNWWTKNSSPYYLNCLLFSSHFSLILYFYHAIL